MSTTTIAFIGLGNMGGPMAANLVKAGMTVHGFDVVDQARTRAQERGIIIFDSAIDAAREAEIVITMLPNGTLARQVITDILSDHAQSTASDDALALFIDSSTIAVSEAREIAELVQQAGYNFVDAPVSGGVTGSEAGTLAFMVGGSDAAFAQAESICAIMGRCVTHCGEVGNGQAVKACNNMILAVHQIVLAEALVLGERLGLAHQAFFDVVSNATGDSWALSVNAPVPDVVPSSPANNEFKPGFATALMVKDLKLAMAAATETGTDTVLGKIAAEQYEQFMAADEDNSRRDFSAIIEQVRAITQ
ncbi:3-hydroxyisobutyrate dehydrogenase [Corynebacterium sp. sy017]|uniref:3-hydroxyisobutyrate dehydrogenase n=1 Tax=unclassified Corynebacterium TaxID=2624378 RepID=UPI0011867FBA|nr:MULTISPECIES: 3-hydroxyisobutyrate dehydrogenase [unclassified Corynebacterium]MBP3088311.1 3-hydroxyisobutyrate dehydrogenase [Corynebacterium sp. sy017]TSD91634.1 3-hydroxyisobutyrate dehydrogenase [Corynebacterium sp. SY003]